MYDITRIVHVSITDVVCCNNLREQHDTDGGPSQDFRVNECRLGSGIDSFFFFYWPVPVACLAVVAGASHFDLAVAAIGWIDTVEELVSRLPESRQPKVHKLAVRVA